MKTHNLLTLIEIAIIVRLDHRNLGLIKPRGCGRTVQ